MHIRRFEGSSMREVLREVRETLGPDALVVSTKHLRRDRGLFGQFGKPTIEVTAAVDHEPARASAPQSGQPHASWNELRLARSVVTPLEGEIQQLDPDHPVTELWQVMRGDAPGRVSQGQITLFDSVGFAIEDFSALRYVHARIEDSDYHQPLDLLADPDDPRDLFGMLGRAA